MTIAPNCYVLFFFNCQIAVCSAFILAFHNGVGLAEVKKGALALWPLFGTVNQLMAAMALFVITVFLARRKTPSFITAVPLVFMVFVTSYAMIYNLNKFMADSSRLLFAVGLAVFALEIWMIIESLIVLRKIFNDCST